MSEYDDADDDLPPPQNRTIVWLKRLGLALAVLLLMLTVVNASWMVKGPPGYVKLLAHRGTMQQFDHAGLTNDGCSATRIEKPVHDFLEDTIEGVTQAGRLGAQMIRVDVAPTKDRYIVLFHDWTVDCRTNGKGAVRDKTWAELKTLDIGYGYTADGGKTYPFRGQGVGKMPLLTDTLAFVPDTALLYNLKSKDPAEADLLIATLKDAGRDVVKRGDGFQGAPAQVERFRKAFPGAWAFSPEGAKQCTKDYLLQGWLTRVPDSCKGGTLMVPLNYQWAFAGWPDKTQNRMKEAGARILLTGPYGQDHAGSGLDLPEQIGKVPASFVGTVWVDDIYTVGPALRPAYNKRRPDQDQALAEAIAARRKARE